MSAAVSIVPSSPHLPEAQALIAALDHYLHSLYPAESCYLLSPDELATPDVTFLLARVGNEAVGCVALVEAGDYAELKRMFVRPLYRGRGVAGSLMNALVQTARDKGYRRICLEAGPTQPEALALYERHGFQYRGPYGDYREDPHSVFMERSLDTH